ncbi:MAG: HNH endonuclease [Woeseiaceae bacterium]
MGKQPEQGRLNVLELLQGDELRWVMSAYDVARRKEIFKKTNGRCHLCGRRIALKNYGEQDARGAWEVDHSVPRAEGGSDNLNNLVPAHIECNRSKQDTSSRSARRRHGRTRAPMSADAQARARLKQAAGGAIAGALMGARLGGPVGLWIGLIGGGIAAYALDPES